MQLIINQQKQTLIPIRQFRKEYNLPETFGVRLFEPKDFDGLAHLNDASHSLQKLQENVLSSIPTSLSIRELMSIIDDLQHKFSKELYAINPTIALKDIEVEFAIAGFGDMLRYWIYQIIPAANTHLPFPDFEESYDAWLNQTVRISSKIHSFEYAEEAWLIQIINHVYGRVGLMVMMTKKTVYIADGVYICPAERFMINLLRSICTEITQGLLTK